MVLFRIILCIIVLPVSYGQEKSSLGGGDIIVRSYTELKTVSGRLYHNVKVRRVEQDGIMIEHRDGIGKLSFFELNKEMRGHYNFDPIVARRMQREAEDQQRKLKWQRFWDAEKKKKDATDQQYRQRLHKQVRASWIPVEATVLRATAEGAFVRAKRISMVPTKVISKLGFENDGPLKKTLVPMEPSVIFIKATGISGGRWEGYLEPKAHAMKSYPNLNNQEVPSYRAVARTDIK